MTLTQPNRTMTYDDDNRLLTVNGQSVSHDLDGNMTNGPLPGGAWAGFGYDARNRLIAVGGTGSTPAVGYAYDPAGNRIAMTNAGVVTRFVVDPNTPLSRVLMRIKGGVTNYYVYGLGLLYEVTETATNTYARYYHYDYRGSTVALTDHSSLVTDRIEYSAYGTITYRTGTTDTPFLFNGRYGVQTDPNGLLYMRARYYNPYICRFINPDPIGFSGGLNWYAYADGNPVSYLDPFGLWSWPTAGLGVLRAVGGVLEAAAGYSLAVASGTAAVGTSPTVVGTVGFGALAVGGAAVGAHGVDQFQAGIRQVWTGEHVESLTALSLQAAGMSENAANLTDAGIGAVGSLGAGAAALTIRASQIASAEPTLAQGMTMWQMLSTYDKGARALNTADYWALGGDLTSPLYKGLLIQQGVNLEGDAYLLTTTAVERFVWSVRLAPTGLTPLACGFVAGPGGAIGGVANGISWLGTPNPSGK